MSLPGAFRASPRNANYVSPRFEPGEVTWAAGIIYTQHFKRNEDPYDLEEITVDAQNLNIRAIAFLVIGLNNGEIQRLRCRRCTNQVTALLPI